MLSPHRYSAPWGKLLLFFTTLGTIVLLGALWVLMVEPQEIPMKGIMPVFLIFVMVSCTVCMVRGYRIEGDTLIVERLGWEKKLSLLGLKNTYADNALLIGSIRVGNGGLFVFAGWFWTKRLGWFRVLGNDILGRSVLLEFEGRKWVVTPDEPNKFVEEVSQFIK
jgi:hypothetical protein